MVVEFERRNSKVFLLSRLCTWQRSMLFFVVLEFPLYIFNLKYIFDALLYLFICLKWQLRRVACNVALHKILLVIWVITVKAIVEAGMRHHDCKIVVQALIILEQTFKLIPQKYFTYMLNPIFKNFLLFQIQTKDLPLQKQLIILFICLKNS